MACGPVSVSAIDCSAVHWQRCCCCRGRTGLDTATGLCRGVLGWLGRGQERGREGGGVIDPGGPWEYVRKVTRALTFKYSKLEGRKYNADKSEFTHRRQYVVFCRDVRISEVSQAVCRGGS